MERTAAHTPDISRSTVLHVTAKEIVLFFDFRLVLTPSPQPPFLDVIGESTERICRAILEKNNFLFDSSLRSLLFARFSNSLILPCLIGIQNHEETAKTIDRVDGVVAQGVHGVSYTRRWFLV